MALSIKITEAAAARIRTLVTNPGERRGVHLGISPFMQPSLFVGPRLDDEHRGEAHGVEVWVDAASADRAGDGVIIDCVDTARGPDLITHVPAAPQVHKLRVDELGNLMKGDTRFELVDVRS